MTTTTVFAGDQERVAMRTDAQPVRVVVAGDDVATRAGVRAALESDGFKIVAEAVDARSAVAACIVLEPDLCLLDIDLPGNAITACRAIRQDCPDVHPVMLTDAIDEDDLFDALQAGASGYLPWTTPPARMGSALRGVLAGEAALPRSLVATVVTEFRNRRGRRFQIGRRGDALTDGEWDVLELMADGLTTREIARRLSLSPETVRTHTDAIVRKLAVPDRESAVDFVVRQRSDFP